MLYSIIQAGKLIGMCSMDESLLDKVEKGKITARAAWGKASDKTKFDILIKHEEAAGGAAPRCPLSS